MKTRDRIKVKRDKMKTEKEIKRRGKIRNKDSKGENQTKRN